MKHINISKCQHLNRIVRGDLSTNLYLAHTVLGQSFRSLAEELGVHPTTVMRRVRQVEVLRDDPLINEYLLETMSPQMADLLKERLKNNMKLKSVKQLEIKASKEEIRILRRLCETGVFLGIADNLNRGAIFRQINGKKLTRLGVVSREVAKSLTLRDWMKCTKPGAVNIYRVTEVGRLALRRELGVGDNVFGYQHREFETRKIGDKRNIRVNLRESPITILARKKDANGKMFLSSELLQAGERLREDFELAQLGPNVTQNWDRFLLGNDRCQFTSNEGGGGASAAQKRLSIALSVLGTGLGDIALRCCCFLEGLEAAEKRMGWSARSGKVVLRIALQRLRRHYEEEYGGLSPKIG